MAAVLLGAVSCHTTALPPLGTPGSAAQSDDDEQQLWRNADRLERKIDASGARYTNDQLEAYLHGVAGKLLAAEPHSTDLPVRIKVLRHPCINAFALPNGAIYLHTGMLARMDNEAQLAAVLGHELTHYTNRHALKELRTAQYQQAWLGAMQLVLAASGPSYGRGQLGATVAVPSAELGGLLALASVEGYSRALETEADEHGLQLMVQAGYDPAAAPEMFGHLQEDQGDTKHPEPFFLGTHPRLQDRIESYRRLLDTRYAAAAVESGRHPNADEFCNALGELLLDNAALDFEVGRVHTARAAIDRYLRTHPRSARGHFLAGDAQRRFGSDEQHTTAAVGAYQQAARLDAGYAEPHRELGLIYRNQQRLPEARAEFDRYLALSPRAVDAPIIRGYRATRCQSRRAEVQWAQLGAMGSVHTTGGR